MRWWIVLAMSSACGRLGFAPLADDGSTSGGGGGGGRDGSHPSDVLASKVVSFGERPGATYSNVTADTGILGSQPFNNFGAADSVALSPIATGLLRFDISALAPGTAIVAAELHLASASDASGTMGLYGALEAWTEGDGKASSGIANYTMRTSIDSWTDPGANPPSSRGSMTTSFAPAPAGADNTISFDATDLARIRGWIDSPASNFGWVVAPGLTADSWSFITRESAMADLRPLLIVTLQ